MNHIEHPQVTYINRVGYPQDMQEKHWGCDYQGNEILTGDEIVIDPQLDEIIMKEDLLDYLIEKYGFEFTTAE